MSARLSDVQPARSEYRAQKNSLSDMSVRLSEVQPARYEYRAQRHILLDTSACLSEVQPAMYECPSDNAFLSCDDLCRPRLCWTDRHQHRDMQL